MSPYLRLHAHYKAKAEAFAIHQAYISAYNLTFLSLYSYFVLTVDRSIMTLVPSPTRDSISKP